MKIKNNVEIIIKSTKKISIFITSYLFVRTIIIVTNRSSLYRHERVLLVLLMVFVSLSVVFPSIL